MKLYEKILIGVVAVAFLTQPFLTSQTFLYLSLIALFLSYLIGGYWLFNSWEKRQYFLPIVTGIVLASSIYTWFFTIRLYFHDQFRQILPVFNGLLFLSLGVYWLLKRKSAAAPSNIKGIILRSFLIACVTCFFSYAPATVKINREILKALNKGNEYLFNNLLMIDYSQEYDIAYAKKDCDQAIIYAEKANHAGLIWLDKIHPDTIESVSDSFKIPPEELKKIKNELQKSIDSTGLWRIGLTYDNLCNAYNCKGDNEYANGNFKSALVFYCRADNATKIFYADKEDRAWILNRIARCYQKLKQYAISDSLYKLGFQVCLKSKDTFSFSVGILVSDFAGSFAERKYYSSSNSLLRAANSMYKKDSLRNESKGLLLKNYLSLTSNFILQDSIEQALIYIHKAFELEKQTKELYCNSSLQYGICLYKLCQYQKDDSILKDCLQCFSNKSSDQGIESCKLLLAYTEYALGKYDDARKYLDEVMSTVIKDNESKSSLYAQCSILSGNLNKTISEYEKAESDYNIAYSIYYDEQKNEGADISMALGGFADLDIKQSRFKQAKAHADSALVRAGPALEKNSSNNAVLLNELAYVYYATGLYKLSDSLYKKALSLCSYHTTNTATALNGLGLNATAKRNFKSADTLFAKSLKLHLSIFTEKNPMTAQVYLNYGLLDEAEGKLDEAEAKINKALEVDKKFFKADHDIFGDIYMALGDVYKKKGQVTSSRDYYQKALDIYAAKFEGNHWKVINAKRKLN